MRPEPSPFPVWLSEQVPAASVVFFRIVFGLMMALWAFDYLWADRVRLLCAPRVFHFHWDGFSWVKPWPGCGMVLQFIGMLLAAIMIATGTMYRAAVVVFALGFTHFFLIDRTNYQNHYYLILLLSWLMLILPANRFCSTDVLNGAVIRSRTIPRWTLLMLQFHIALPYVFGGAAKIDADWLNGEPMRNILRIQSWFEGDSAWLSEHAVPLVFTWGGLLFDLLIVPSILWRRTRLLAFLLVVGFHLSNSLLFRIHVFPWLMIAATTIFFDPDWPEKVLQSLSGKPTRGSLPDLDPQRCKLSRPVVALMLLYCGFHILWPFRHFLYEGNTSWTEQGHYFAWRMMLRGKTVGLRYYLMNPATGKTQPADIRQFLNREQQMKFARDPEMIRDLAQELATYYHKQTGEQIEVRALVLASLNGRKPQLLIDPAVNLAEEPEFAFHRPWIIPLTEPLRREPWTIPLDEWERHVDLPDLPFLHSQTRVSAFKN